MADPSSNFKDHGDISSVFPSLSGIDIAPLPPRFAKLKKRLIHGHEERVQDSWYRLLAELKNDVEMVKEQGSCIIPEMDYKDLTNVTKRTKFRDGLYERGVAVIRGVVPEQEALNWKKLLRRYIKDNPSTKGFPATNPTIYELYWSPSQILARAHPNVLRTQAFLMSHWHSKNKSAMISTSHPLIYADRLRIREPGDAGFVLGPHIDSGSCERWEEDGYGKGGVFNKIFQGDWEQFDPWESSCRLSVVSDLYNGAGACSMFRMFQGWVSMSTASAGEGTLMVNPLLKKTMAYLLLRPFFKPVQAFPDAGSHFLEMNNWRLEDQTSSNLQGAVPSNCQELNDAMHPHLELNSTMVHVPQVRPGDYVAWHCDTVHAVDKIHTGSTDSSVMYIPACPLTETNAEYSKRQRETFVQGVPAPDYPGGIGEANHLGLLTPEFVMQTVDIEAQRAMGLVKFDPSSTALSNSERLVLKRANEILGFA